MSESDSVTDEKVGLVKMAVLDRRLHLGALYDVRTSSAIPAFSGKMLLVDHLPIRSLQTTWLNDSNNALMGPDLSDSMSSSVAGLEYDPPFYHRGKKGASFQQLLCPQISGKLKVSKLPFENGPVSSKHHHMKLSSHLKTSVMAGLVDKHRDATKYLLDDDVDITQAVRTIRVRIVGRKLELDESPEDPTCQGTHWVAAMKQGAEAFITFQRCLSDGESKKAVERQMDDILEDFVNALRDQQTELDLPWDLRGRFYGDLHDQPRDCSLKEAFKLVREMVEILETDPSRAVPLTVWLKPMEWMTGAIPDLDDELLAQCQDFLDGIAKLKSMAQTLLSEDQLELFPHLIQSLHPFVEYLNKRSQSFRSQLRRDVLALRLGHTDGSSLRNLLDQISTHPDILATWLKEKQSEFQALRAIGNIAEQKGIPLVQSQEELNRILLNTRTKWILALVLPSTNGLANPSFLSDDDLNIPDALIVKESKSEELRKTLMKVARRMFQQAERKGDQVGYMLTSLLPSSTPYRPSLTLLENGEVVSRDFHLPVPPHNVRLNLENSPIVVEWDSDNQPDHVLHYAVQFKFSQDSDGWSTLTTSGPVKATELKSIRYPAGYQFRVATVSRIGWGEFSEILHIPAAHPSPLSVPASADKLFQEKAMDQIEQLQQRVMELVNCINIQNSTFENKLQENAILIQSLQSRLQDVETGALESNNQQEDVNVRLAGIESTCRHLQDRLDLLSANSQGLIATMKAEQGMDPSITDDAARFQSANIGTEVAALEARITGVDNLCRTLQHQMKIQELRVKDFRSVFVAFANANKAVLPVFGVSCARQLDAGKYVTFAVQESFRNDYYGRFDRKRGLFTARAPGS